MIRRFKQVLLSPLFQCYRLHRLYSPPPYDYYRNKNQSLLLVDQYIFKMFARASRIGVLWIAAITLCCICISAQQITQECIGCICEVTSGCNTTLGCDGPVCGPFYITKAYWIDAGKPTKADDISNNNDDENYSNCAQDVYCAGRTVQNYMVKFKQDCNGDGVINCDDYVRLHRYGVSGCTNQLHSVYESIYKLCIDNFA